MISEGSCCTEDWSNDAENVALITAINYIKNKLSILIIIIIVFYNLVIHSNHFILCTVVGGLLSVIIFHNKTVFFKCSLSKHKRLLSKTLH